jgi:monoamine oxidase
MSGPNSTDPSRRRFLKTSAAWTAAGFATGAGVTAAARLAFRKVRELETPVIPGELLGPSAMLGHRLRTGSGFPLPRTGVPARKVGVLVVGGGVAGLSAAWTLDRKGFSDFALLELEAEAGGNARFGENAISRYPLGAHYLPLPNRESESVHELLEELGVMRRGVAGGAPRFEEEAICAAPAERLFLHGHWQEGLVPQGAAFGKAVQQETERFQAEMDAFRGAYGQDGKPAFAIPSRLSSQDPRFLELDRLSMAAWMRSRGYRSEPLHWYVDYCCRDDYGARSTQVSAWAGIHYFAGRRGWAEGVSSSQLLTWPEGNGFLIRKLRERLAPRIIPHRVVFDVAPQASSGFEVLAFDPVRGETERFEARTVILATPRLVTSRILAPFRGQDEVGRRIEYAPWMVANLSVRDFEPGEGAPLSWDNVLYHSGSLGYIHARHQNIERYSSQETVLTHYWALADSDPRSERKAAYERSRGDWLQWILRDLKPAHPGIAKQLTRADLWLWGHAMAIPAPGRILSQQSRQLALAPRGIEFAHSDLSGLSIFEEAQDQGVQAAVRVLARLRGGEGKLA